MGKQIVTAAPSGTGIEWADWIGKLFVVEPLEVAKDVKTVHGVTDAVRANVYVLLGKDKQEECEDTLVFPKVLQGQLRKAIGTSIVVGRLTQGEKKSGQNPPWVFAEATAADLKKAADFWAAHSVGSASAAEDEYDDDDAAEDDSDAF